MIQRVAELVSSWVFWGGSCCVLLAVGIILKRDSRKYLRDSELLKIVREFKEKMNLTPRIRGFVRATWVWLVCAFALLGFASVPFKHIILPPPTMVAHWWYFPYVPEMMPANEYIVLHMNKTDPLYGTRSRYTFCGKGHEIDIDEREMIKDVVFRDHGECIELLNYNYEREDYPPYNVKRYEKEAFLGNRP